MKQGLSLQSLAREVERQNSAKLDFKAVAGRDFRMDNDNNIAVIGHDSFRPTDHAHSQIAAYTGIKQGYYDMMRADKTANTLMRDNVNHWLDKKAEPRLVRTLDGSMRALLSNGFRRLDNAQIMTAALPTLMEYPDLQYDSCEITSRRLYLKCTTPKITGEVRKGDAVQFGLYISNSEVGGGQLMVWPFVKILKCLNGLIMEEGGTKRRHVGGRVEAPEDGAEEYFSDDTIKAADEAFFLKLRDTIRHTLTQEGFTPHLRKLQQAAGDMLPELATVEGMVEVLGNRHGLLEGERASVLRNLIEGADLSRYGFHNAVTAVANDIESYDRATELEEIGGRIINLDRREWHNMAMAA